MENLKFVLQLSSDFQSVAPQCRVSINDRVYFENTVDGLHQVIVACNFENISKNQLRIELINKQQSHTVINEKGVILKDSILTLNSILVEDINILPLLLSQNENCYYEHDNNGTAPLTRYPFVQNIGCNGALVLNFETPIYKWFLINRV